MLREGNTTSRSAPPRAPRGGLPVVALAVAALGLLPSCGGDPTRIVVVVDADLALASVRARTGDPGCSACEHEFALAGEGATTLPFSFVIAPRDGDTSREVRLLVEGRDGEGAAVVTRTVRTRFLSGRTVLLRVLLEDACRGEACVEGTTCVAGSCADDTIDPATLRDVEPGRELELDGGTARDGGDAGEGGSALPRGCGASDSGAITIDPDGTGPGAPFEVICDASDGGGWVLIANVTSASASLGYDGPAWTGAESMADPTPGVAPADEGLFLPYWRTSIAEVRLVAFDDMTMTMRDLTVSLVPPAPTTLRSAMETPGSVGLSGSAADWAALVGAGAGASCTIAGVGVGMQRARIRIGALITDDAGCSASSSADAFFGVAAAVEGGGPCADAPLHHSGGSTFCVTPMSGRMGYPAQVLVYGRAPPDGSDG